MYYLTDREIISIPEFKTPNFNLWPSSDKENDLGKPTFGLVNSPIYDGTKKGSFSTINIPIYSFLHSTSNENINNNNEGEIVKTQCSSILFEDTKSVEALSLPRSFSDNDWKEMKTIMDKMAILIDDQKFYGMAYVFADFNKMKTEETKNKFIAENFFKTDTVSVWLDKYKIYFTVSTIIYTDAGDRNKPKVRIFYAQVFSKDWKEKRHFRFPNYSRYFPSILPIPMDFNNEKGNKVGDIGPKDPQIILRKTINAETGEISEEPIIIYTTKVKKNSFKRVMHAMHPLINTDKPPVPLKFPFEHENEIKEEEKNWIPFFNDQDDDINHIHFIYSLKPLTIAKCHIWEGNCTITTNEFYKINSPDTRSTQLTRIPTALIPINKFTNNKIFWTGFISSNVQKCGCINELWRPQSTLLSFNTITGKYTIEYISSLLDFNINPPTWGHQQKSICEDGISKFTPGSIVYWDFERSSELDSENIDIETALQQNDYMAITYSMSDKVSKVLLLRGWLKHIRNVLSTDRINDDDILSTDLSLLQCSLETSESYCKASEDKFKWSTKTSD
ncbi:uncharacterized protein RJT21DRAFT_88833 [Scheffersomyces amazonensis]|uniref:uncharacterized protein n=1 Tax=Scheffersomyces amazonensis TaxID=1078765 RepID=UPI00315D7BA9